MFILDAFYYFFYLVLVITLSNFSSIYAIFCHISCQFAEVLDQNIRRCGANVLARLWGSEMGHDGLKWTPAQVWYTYLYFRCLPDGGVERVSMTACSLRLCSLHGTEVTTVEGLGSTKHNQLHPIQVTDILNTSAWRNPVGQICTLSMRVTFLHITKTFSILQIMILEKINFCS